MPRAQLSELLSHGHMRLCGLKAYALINKRHCCLNESSEYMAENMAVVKCMF